MNSTSAILYAANVSSLADSRLFSEAIRSVSPERRAKAARFVFPADKYCCLGAEILLKKALSDFGAPVSETHYIYGEYGKPYLTGSDMPYFSISHSGEYVLCAVADAETGCDIEKIKDISFSIPERFFCRAEYLDIVSQNGKPAQLERFYRYWTLKESFLKVTGLGMNLPFDKFEILLPSSRSDGRLPGGSSGEAQISVTQHLDRRSYQFSEYPDIAGYRCALCLAGAEAFPALKMLDLPGCL